MIVGVNNTEDTPEAHIARFVYGMKMRVKKEREDMSREKREQSYSEVMNDFEKLKISMNDFISCSTGSIVPNNIAMSLQNNIKEISCLIEKMKDWNRKYG